MLLFCFFCLPCLAADDCIINLFYDACCCVLVLSLPSNASAVETTMLLYWSRSEGVGAFACAQSDRHRQTRARMGDSTRRGSAAACRQAQFFFGCWFSREGAAGRPNRKIFRGGNQRERVTSTVLTLKGIFDLATRCLQDPPSLTGSWLTPIANTSTTTPASSAHHGPALLRLPVHAVLESKCSYAS